MMNYEMIKISLMIVGSEKSGTTSLFRLLADHPEIHCHEQREMVYFRAGEYASGWQSAVDKYFGVTAENRILIAKDVFAMYSTMALQRIYEHNPNIQIVLMLRNPIARAYSAYWYSRRRGRESLKTFEAALDAEKNRLEHDPVKWLPNAYANNGLYIGYLMNIIEIFGTERVHICFTEQLKHDSTRLCQRIFSDIGIDSLYKPGVMTWQNKSGMVKSETFARHLHRLLKSHGILKKFLSSILPANKVARIKHALLRINEKPFTPPPVCDDTREILNRKFQQANVELASLTGSEIPLNWK